MNNIVDNVSLTKREIKHAEEALDSILLTQSLRDQASSSSGCIFSDLRSIDVRCNEICDIAFVKSNGEYCPHTKGLYSPKYLRKVIRRMIQNSRYELDGRVIDFRNDIKETLRSQDSMHDQMNKISSISRKYKKEFSKV